METTILKISGTEDTPEILYNPDDNQLIISGRSLPEDVTNFYKPVFAWLDEFATQLTESINVKFKLEYFNTASSKIILDILMRLEEIGLDNNKTITIEWHYMDGDDDMAEAGDEYKELVELKFNLISY